jgi:signal transduction histidine kinase
MLAAPPIARRSAAPALWAVAAIMLPLAVLFGLLEAAQTHWRASMTAHPFPWSEALFEALPPWLLFGLLAPGAFLLTERFRLDRRPHVAAALVHVIAAAVYAVVHQYGAALFFVTFYKGALALDAVGMKFQKMLTFNFALDVITYCALVGGFHALLYHRELRSRELAASQLQAGLTQARLEALRAQLNPHFLFNTLNAISALALKGDHEGVVQTLSLLSDLLRLSLDGHLPQEVTLADELAFTDRYLELQRIRFSDRLGIRKEIDPSALQALVPSLLLQPVVENAVVHGVAAQRGPGRIDIRAVRDGETLRLDVSDTGPGFSANFSVREEHDTANGNGSNGNGLTGGVGLRNTRARLQHLYGDAQTLSCRNLDGGGAIVSIRIPYMPVRGAV